MLIILVSSITIQAENEKRNDFPFNDFVDMDYQGISGAWISDFLIKQFRLDQNNLEFYEKVYPLANQTLENVEGLIETQNKTFAESFRKIRIQRYIIWALVFIFGIITGLAAGTIAALAISYYNILHISPY